MTEIVEVDPTDEPMVRAFWEAGEEAIRADRAHPVLRTWDALWAMVRDPSPYSRAVLLAALDGSVVVGGVELAMPLRDNGHLGELEVNVRPAHRRRGIATALYAAAKDRFDAAGRTTLLGEAHASLSGPGSASIAFAESLGFTSVHVEDHLLLSLPVPPGHVDGLRAALPALDDYELVAWGDHCPDEHLDAYCAMRTRMDADVPLGEIDLEVVVYDEERVRTSETRLSRSYHGYHVAARRLSDGVFGGFSMMMLPHGDDLALQFDTLVMPEHRGRRLGLRMKLDTLGRVQAEHPGRTAFHTWTAQENAAMQATNRRFGYVVVDRMHEMQLRLG